MKTRIPMIPGETFKVTMNYYKFDSPITMLDGDMVHIPYFNDPNDHAIATVVRNKKVIRRTKIKKETRE
jgi:hypothetical protein